MDTKELLEKKKKMDDEIGDIVRSFEKESHMIVRSISIGGTEILSAKYDGNRRITFVETEVVL